MGVRITGISTPVGGLSWEYTKKEATTDALINFSGQKIKVFISSICGQEKYDKVRNELKKAIENTQFAEVYTFESRGASTLPAGAHYKLALEDSDICIFLIDNADGVSPGVQAEIEIVNKYKIQALYYFCDERKKEKTLLEKNLMGANFTKSKTVHSFSELSQEGAQALIDDIVTVYRYYCKGKIVLKSDANDDIQSVEILGTEKHQIPTIPKATLKNVAKCKNYILKFVIKNYSSTTLNETENTSELDDWGVQFLAVLLEGKSIKHFNTMMYLSDLEDKQDASYHQIVQKRWCAIQAYFSDNVDESIKQLTEALKLAKESKQPMWIINDILIDLRNQQFTYDEIKNKLSNATAQTELLKSNEEIHYPILDRIHNSLHEEFIKGLYKNKITSPYTVTFGSNIDQCCEMLASSLIVSMYNGSLTHIVCIYKEIRSFVFYLSCKYNDWYLKLNLYKLAIFDGKAKDIDNIQRSFPEVLSKLNADEAKSIMIFCTNHPIKHKKLSSQLLAFGAVGYFLDDKSFSEYEKFIVQEIEAWLNSDNHVMNIGQHIFKCLSGIAYRIPHDIIGKICCNFIDKHYSCWYRNIFKLIFNYLDLKKMSDDSAKNLVEHINKLLDMEADRDLIKRFPAFLYTLRKQNRALTEIMDKKIAQYLPSYYEGDYKLEATENKKLDMPVLLRQYAEKIQNRNNTQGKNGTYSWNSECYIATARAILLEKNVVFDAETMNMLISTVADTLLISKEDISTKLDAVGLLICIIVKYPQDYIRNQSIYNILFEQQEEIEAHDDLMFSANIDNVSLKMGLQFLYVSMGKDVYAKILELMSLIQENDATTIAVTRLIAEYLETTDTVILPSKVEAVVLQKVLQWLHAEHLDIRWNAVRILFSISRNPENYGIVNRQLVALIDSDNVYIKNLIIRHLYEIKGINQETKDYIISKCKNDANFVVRMVCAEVENKNSIKE